LFLALPNSDANIIKEFIWKGKTDKIKREIAVQNNEKEGLKILDINLFIISLKSTWIRIYLSGNSNWMCILDSYIEKAKLVDCGPNYVDIIVSQ